MTANPYFIREEDWRDAREDYAAAVARVRQTLDDFWSARQRYANDRAPQHLVHRLSTNHREALAWQHAAALSEKTAVESYWTKEVEWRTAVGYGRWQ